jgi:hypothetical protein
VLKWASRLTVQESQVSATQTLSVLPSLNPRRVQGALVARPITDKKRWTERCWKKRLQRLSWDSNLFVCSNNLRFMRMQLLICALFLLGIGSASPPLRSQGKYTVQPVDKAPDVAASLVIALEPHGIRLVNPFGHPVCDIWWSKAVGIQPPGKQPSTTRYANLEPGTLAGVIYFPTQNEDSRDQKLKPGYYTMRYAQLSIDDQQAGNTSLSEYVVLSPASVDFRPDPVKKVENLVHLSLQASRSADPAALSLLPVNSAFKGSPAILSDDQGNCTLQTALHGKSGSGEDAEIEIAILLVTGPRPDPASCFLSPGE